MKKIELDFKDEFRHIIKKGIQGPQTAGPFSLFMRLSLGLSFDDVLLIPQKSAIESRAQVDLTTEIAPNFFLKIPIIATKMDTITDEKMAIEISRLGGLALMPRFESPEEQAKKIFNVKRMRERVFATVGLRDDYLKRAEACLKAGAVGLILDVAHGHMTKSLEAITKLKNRFPNYPLIAGIVATYEGAFDSFAAGADTVSVGIGASPICSTRIVTGCGVPSLTSLWQAVKAAKKFKNKFVLNDSGIKNSGDLVKALAAGTSGSICGYLLAGVDEAPGAQVNLNGRFYKEYHGSTSLTQKQRELKKVKRDGESFIHHVEGVEGLVSPRGPLEQHLKKICAGLRSGFSYCGAQNIRELWKKAKFLQVTSSGLQEGQTNGRGTFLPTASTNC